MSESAEGPNQLVLERIQDGGIAFVFKSLQLRFNIILMPLFHVVLELVVKA